MQAEHASPVPEITESDIVWQASTGLVERALLARCDAIWLITGNLVRPELIEVARRVGLAVHVWMTETPYNDAEYVLATRVDGCWTNERSAVGRFRGLCGHAAYLPHGWREGVHNQPAQPVDEQLPAHDVVFVGTYFSERLALLEAVDWSGIDLGLYGMTDMIPAESPLRRFVRSELTANDVTTALYRRAKVGLNLYRAGGGESLNPRAYELAAAGVCQISEHRAEIGEVFGGSVPTFRGAADLEATVRRLLEKPFERRGYAMGAQQAVREAHWGFRAEQMWQEATRWAA